MIFFFKLILIFLNRFQNTFKHYKYLKFQSIYGNMIILKLIYIYIEIYFYF